MIRLSDKTIERALGSGEPQRLYTVAGNDEYLVDRCVREIVERVTGGDEDGIQRFEQSSLENGWFEELFTSFSLLGIKRVAVVGGFSESAVTASQYKLLASCFSDIPEDLTVVLSKYSDDKRFSISKKLEEITALCSDSALVTVTAKTGTELLTYIDDLIRSSGCTAKENVAREIAELCGNDLLMISNEIQKFSALSGFKEITAEHVRQLGTRNTEAGVFDMISAIERGNIKSALSVLGDMLDNREPPLLITTHLNTAYINMFRAKLARESKRSESFVADNFNYKKGDRKLSIAFERCKAYKLETLSRIIELLYLLDKKLKSSAADSRILLEQKIVEIAIEASR